MHSNPLRPFKVLGKLVKLFSQQQGICTQAG